MSIRNNIYKIILFFLFITPITLAQPYQREINLNAVGVPHGMRLTPDGSKLYVANLSLDRISIVNGITDEYGDYDDIVLPQGTQPMQAYISPDGKYLSLYLCKRNC